MNSKFLISFNDGYQEEYDAKDWPSLLISLPIYFADNINEIEKIEICKRGDCSKLRN